MAARCSPQRNAPLPLQASRRVEPPDLDKAPPQRGNQHKANSTRAEVATKAKTLAEAGVSKSAAPPSLNDVKSPYVRNRAECVTQHSVTGGASLRTAFSFWWHWVENWGGPTQRMCGKGLCGA